MCQNLVEFENYLIFGVIKNLTGLKAEGTNDMKSNNYLNTFDISLTVQSPPT